MEKTAEKVWANCLKVIRDNISYQSFKTWFEPIKPIKLEEKILTIQVPSQFFYEWIEEHFITIIRKVIRKELGIEGKLEYSIVIENSTNETKPPLTVRIPTSNIKDLRNRPISIPVDLNEGSPIKNPFIIPGLKKVQVQSNLLPIYTFDNFVEGDCNRLARSAGIAVAKKPGGTSFNPFFIYSGIGLGKTHLVQAIGIQIKSNIPEKTVLYVQCDKFMNQFVDAVKSNNTNDFVHFYQMLDVLIIDDVQFLGGKEKTQDIFFHIFNHLHQTGKQIILASDKPPVELHGIEPRLLSRFKWGLSADIQNPDFETRVAILEKKLYNDGIEMPKEVIDFIAYSITTNIRELEGAYNSILGQSTFTKRAITIELAKQTIDVFVKNTTREVSIDYIQKVVCDYFNIAIEMINSKTRKREVVQARQIAMYFSKNLTKSSLAAIGLNCGNKDHATVLHACRTVNNLIDTDKRFKTYIDELEKKIKM